jgi:hypothetical protein
MLRPTSRSADDCFDEYCATTGVNSCGTGSNYSSTSTRLVRGSSRHADATVCIRPTVTERRPHPFRLGELRQVEIRVHDLVRLIACRAITWSMEPTTMLLPKKKWFGEPPSSLPTLFTPQT